MPICMKKRVIKQSLLQSFFFFREIWNAKKVLTIPQDWN